MDLVRRLGYDPAPVSRGCFTVGVCPVESGSDAARMAAELAILAARESGARILMVETNVTSPICATAFGLGEGAPGLGEMLAPPPHNRFDTIHPTHVPNLFVMPAGSLRETPTKPQLEWLHGVLARHFQGMVIELPAMGEIRARSYCARIPNAVVLVSHSGCGSWSVKRAVKRLRNADANLVASHLMR